MHATACTPSQQSTHTHALLQYEELRNPLISGKAVRRRTQPHPAAHPTFDLNSPGFDSYFQLLLLCLLPLSVLPVLLKCKIHQLIFHCTGLMPRTKFEQNAISLSISISLYLSKTWTNF